MASLIPQMQEFINVVCFTALLVMLFGVLPFVFVEIKRLVLLWRNIE
jgi:hypothetical protein